MPEREPVRLRAATRASALARWQTDHVARLLVRAGAELGLDVQVEAVVVQTKGDARQDVPIWAMGGKGVFVKEVQAAVLDGRADLAVHSGKDLPSVEVPGLVLAAVPERADARDVLVGATLDGLAPGATVATGSVRRRAQLAWRRPDLTFTGLRGNIATRLDRIPPGGAVVVAAAAIERLGIDLAAHEHEVLDAAVVLPQVAQGALAVECGSDDARLRQLLAAIEHRPSRRAVDAERAYLATLGGDCDLPAGAHAVPLVEGAPSPGGAPGDVPGGAATSDERLVLEVLLASLDGHVVLRHRVGGDDPQALGRDAAHHLLDQAGGRSLLASWAPPSPSPTSRPAQTPPRDPGSWRDPALLRARDRAKNERAAYGRAR